MKRRSFLQNLAGAFLLAPGSHLASKTIQRPNLSAFSQDDENGWRLIRQSFPLAGQRIYFNTGGLGPSPFQVLEAVHEKQLELETISETGHHYHREVREKVAAFVGANAAEIAFTRNATEGMNFIARGIPLKAGDEVITTTHEHPGGAIPWLAVAKQSGIQIKLIEPIHDDPAGMEKLIQKQITSRTRVLMLSHILCTIGTVFQARQLCKMARAHGLISVLDGAQAVGQVRVNLHETGCDFYVTSGHKWLLGPKGSGFIYIAEHAQEYFQPSFVGAYSDNGYDLNALELAFRKDAIVTEYGTRDAAKIWGVGAAVDFMKMIGMQQVESRVKFLASRLKNHLDDIAGASSLTPKNQELSAGIVTFKIENHASTEVSRILGQKYKMRVRNIHENNINGTRISLHIFHSKDEVDALAQAIREIANG